MPKPQRIRREDGRRRSGVALAREDVDDHIGRVDALGHRLGTGGLDRRQPVGEHGGENGDHLAIAVIGTGEFASHPLQRGRQHPVLERRAVAQCPGLAGQDRHVVPWIIDRLAAPIAAGMFRDRAPVLADDDAIGIGMDLDRPANGAGVHRVFVVVEANQAGLRHRGRQRVEAIEPAAIRDEVRPLLLEHLPNGLLRPFRMGMRLGVSDAFVGQPGVQLIIGFDPKARREETFAHETDLVLDLTLLPARGWRAGHRINQMVAAHLQEAPIILPVLADEDRLHRGLHVVVDAARAGASEKGEGPLVRVEHHLLRLARIGANEHHPAVAQAHRARPSRSPSRRSSQRSRGSSRTGRLRPARTTTARKRPPSGSRGPGSRSAHSGEPRHSRPRNPASPQLFEQADQRQTFARRIARRSPSTSDRDPPSNDPAGGAAEPPARRKTMSRQSAEFCAPCCARSSGRGRSP